jgi:hypothetical protein
MPATLPAAPPPVALAPAAPAVPPIAPADGAWTVVMLSAGTASVKSCALVGRKAGTGFQYATDVDCSPSSVAPSAAPRTETCKLSLVGALLINTSTSRPASRNALTSKSGLLLVASMRLAPRPMKRA